MADYYDVEVKSDGSMKVTPQDNAGCGTVIGVIIVMLVLAIIFSFSGSGSGSSNDSYNNNRNQGVANHSYGLDSYVDTDGTVDLFDAPVSRINQGAIEIVSYSTYEHTDLDGYIHRDCYMLLCEGNDYFVGYELNGEFTRLTGQLYVQSDSAVYWLEFYDGDTLIYTTPYLSENNISCDVNINVSNVDFLTIYLCSDGDSGWIIAEDFILSE